MDGRTFCIRRKPDAQAERRPSRRLGMQMRELRQHLFALGLERIDAQVERRAARERGALGGAVFAEDARKMRIEPVGIIAENMRRRACEPVAGECRRAPPPSTAQARSASPLHSAAISATSSPRSRRSMPITAARGPASPISHADDDLRRNVS